MMQILPKKKELLDMVNVNNFWIMFFINNVFELKVIFEKLNNQLHWLIYKFKPY